MLYSILLGLLIVVSIVVVVAVLLQSGKGGGLAASFGGMTSSSDSLFGTRQAGNLLTKTTWYGGALFLFLAFVLSLMSARTRQPESVLDEAFQAPVSQPAAPAPSGGAPAVPLEPAAPSGGAAPTTPAPQP